MAGETKREKAPSGAQNPPLSHVVPPSIARGNELNTAQAHANSFSPDVSVRLACRRFTASRNP
jgi:hypothetical protein